MREILNTKHVSPPQDMADEVQYYLSQSPRQLPSRYFYDPLGSALFEAICRLPWYGITRAELGLLKAHAREILGRLDPLSTVVELGSGSGEKLVALLESGRVSSDPLSLHLIDISAAALASSSYTLRALDAVHIVAHEASYEMGLAEVARRPNSRGRQLVLFLGSNIGNFDPPGADAFLRTIRAAMRPEDGLLLGADLVKNERDLELAYDDPLGITAAFNRNLLVRLNRELGANFDLAAFTHRAVWNEPESRVEMHLVSLGHQRVRIPGANLDLTLEAGESIWTESSYKYRPDTIAAMLGRAGFTVAQQWIDAQRGFALSLASIKPEV
jgi:L-histidine N-alpha-methyltransferase